MSNKEHGIFLASNNRQCPKCRAIVEETYFQETEEHGILHVNSTRNWENLVRDFNTFIDAYHDQYTAPQKPKFFGKKNLTKVLGEKGTRDLQGLLKDALLAVEPSGQTCEVCQGPVEELFTADAVSRGLFERPVDPSVKTRIKALQNFCCPIQKEFLQQEEIKSAMEYMQTSQQDLQGVPFFSETVLYALYGKDTARSVLWMIRQIAKQGRQIYF